MLTDGFGAVAMATPQLCKEQKVDRGVREREELHVLGVEQNSLLPFQSQLLTLLSWHLFRQAEH